MLVELAIGDAYGAGFEYASSRIVREQNDLSGYVQHPRYSIVPGAYTDDAQMSIAIAECIVAGVPWTRDNLARHFVEAFKRDPREGYARGFFSFLCEVQDADDFLARIRPDSEKSGAAMRAAPIGVSRQLTDVIERATIQAKLTHDTPKGIAAAVVAALMSHYFVYELGPKRNLPDFICEYVAGDWSTPWTEKVGGLGVMSVHAAITAIVNHASMSKILHACIAYTGDVDTVATIALAAASCSQEVVQDLPTPLYDGLEQGPYGLAFLRDLDQRLMACAHG